MSQSNSVQEVLGLRRAPIAIAFLDQPPPGLSRREGADVPAGCAFWREAMDGRAFYTVAADHYNCAVGSYTHRVDLPPERAHELNNTLQRMVQNRYLTMAEVPGIPRLDHAPAFVAYGPVDQVAFPPDVVLMALNAAQAMIVYEAALRAGASASLDRVLGRPSCAVLPLALTSGAPALSLGCAGNRMYTGVGEDELYVAIPGEKWADFVASVHEAKQANEDMTPLYAARQATQV